MQKNHSFHLVNISPWPILGSLVALIFMTGIIKWFNMFNNDLFYISFFLIIMIMYQWWRDILRESTFQGIHTLKVSKGMRWGMILFITSEIMFFISFFWGFFHNSLCPIIDLGMNWPPLGIMTFNPIQIPLLNTIILISSGLSVTWAHHALMENNYKEVYYGLMITIILGFYFSLLQAYEYYESSFCMSDCSYGSSFFISTGFHGIHVIIGTIFLTVSLIRHINNHFSKNHHFGFEAAAWYWHFVDVVWLFLYCSIYWWGS